MRFLHRPPLVSVFTNHLIEYPTPVNINYWWGLGSMAGIFLVLQLITGIFLAMHYTPHVNLAFLSVEHIMRDVNYGWLIRYLHANGASFFFLVVYIHIFRGLYYGSYMKPRGFVWCIGVVIFILMMATAFMGYVLPWGQMSLWAATVITNLFSAIPLVGPAIVEWLWGGFSVDNATLNRFFSFHYLLPFLIVACVLVHLAALHHNGSNNPLGISTESDKLSFYPYLWVKDVFGWVSFGLVICFFVYFFPNYLGHTDNYIEANPMVTPAHIVPEWYFLPYYAILRSIPHKLGGVIAMFGAILVLLLLPYINICEVRSSLFRPIYRKFFWVFFLDWLILGWIGGNVPESPFVEIGQFFTLFYFLFVIVFIPLIGFVENYFQNSFENNVSLINSDKHMSANKFLYSNVTKFKSNFGGRFISGKATACFFSNLVSMNINNKAFQVNKGFTVLQACESLGVLVPRFCYHEQLSIAGNCRMCLVEILQAPKLQVSCALPVAENSFVITDSIAVRKARESVMEFLLANHPLDCPICDQGGECDLQDQALGYGNDFGRFSEYKRATLDKHFGPLIKTVMTRCIHCTRCIRFASEIMGISDLGSIGRGSNLEIERSPFDRFYKADLVLGYLEETGLFSSELSGNLVDVCPVGALTSLPYAFTARNWELKSVETIDIFDSLNCSIRVDYRGFGPNSILRVLPRVGTKWVLFEEKYFLSGGSSLFFVDPPWISDKVRFFYDGLKKQRLLVPLIRIFSLKYASKVLSPVNWVDAFRYGRFLLNNFVRNNPNLLAVGLANSEVDVETLFLLKCFLNQLNSDFVLVNNPSSFSVDSVKIKNYNARLFSSNNFYNVLNNDFVPRILKNLESSDLCLLVNLNPRFEAPSLNLRLRNHLVANPGYKIGIVGSLLTSLPYPFYHIGHSVRSLLEVVEGRHFFVKYLLHSKSPFVLVGSSLFDRLDGFDLWNLLRDFLTRSFVINNFSLGVLHGCSTSVASMVLGLNFFHNGQNILNSTILNKACFIYAIGNDCSVDLSFFGKNCLLFYQGYQGDNLAQNADVVFPGVSFVEKNGVFLSTEGRIQQTGLVISPVGDARVDWCILRAFVEVLWPDSAFVKKIQTVDCLSVYLKTYGIDYNTFSSNLFLRDVVNESYLKQTFKSFEHLFSVDNFSQKSIAGFNFKNNIFSQDSLNNKNCFFLSWRIFSNNCSLSIRKHKIPVFFSVFVKSSLIFLVPFFSPVDNFYLTHGLCMSSQVLSRCSLLSHFSLSNFLV